MNSPPSQPGQPSYHYPQARNNDILVVDLLSTILVCYITYCLIYLLSSTLNDLTYYNQWLLMMLALIYFCSHFIPHLFSLEYWNSKLFV